MQTAKPSTAHNSNISIVFALPRQVLPLWVVAENKAGKWFPAEKPEQMLPAARCELKSTFSKPKTTPAAVWSNTKSQQRNGFAFRCFGILTHLLRSAISGQQIYVGQDVFLILCSFIFRVCKLIFLVLQTQNMI